LSVDGKGGLSKKPTRVVSTKKCAGLLGRRCTRDHPHVTLIAGLPSKAEHYPAELADALAQIMMMDDDDELSNDEVFAFSEDDVEMKDADENVPGDTPDAGAARTETPDQFPSASTTTQDETLVAHRRQRSKFGANVFNYVSKLHTRLGHPGCAVLHRMLKDANATENVLNLAKEFRCKRCMEHVKPDTVTTSAPIQAREFGDLVLMDVLSIKVGPKARDIGKVLSMLDMATRYMMARAIPDESDDSVIKAIERMWMRHFGPMKTLRYDEARGFNSRAVVEWAKKATIHLDPAPGEAHARLGAIERRHQVLRVSLENFMADRDLPANFDGLC